MKGPVALGYGTIALLVMVFGVWGTQARLSGAVIAPGVFEPDGMSQILQHPEGGVVTDVRIADGDRVAAGDVLYRLDDTDLRADLGIIEERLLDLSARLHWLANADGPLPDGPLGARILAQRPLFLTETQAHQQHRALLLLQKDQIRLQIDGLHAQRAALEHQARIIAQQLGDLRILFDRGLADAGRLRALERADAEAKGGIGRLTAAIAERSARITELDLQATQNDTERAGHRQQEQRDTRSTIAELSVRREALLAQLARATIRAPVAGTLYGVTVRGTGTVIAPGATLAHLVPEDRALIISAWLRPEDVGRVSRGQSASMTLSDLDTPGPVRIWGQVSHVAASATPHPADGAPVYKVTITPDPAALLDAGADRLRPGQPVDSFIRIADRTPLAYLAQPLTRYLERAWREP